MADSERTRDAVHVRSAIVGWWNTRYGIIGDPPADLCDQFLKDVEAASRRDRWRTR